MASESVKKALREYFKSIVIPELTKNKVIVKEQTPGVFRCNYGNRIIEFYPSSCKYFDISNQLRGNYNNTIEDTLSIIMK
jgi:hypothetical protein